jgi:hypothetical protein
MNKSEHGAATQLNGNLLDSVLASGGSNFVDVTDSSANSRDLHRSFTVGQHYYKQKFQTKTKGFNSGRSVNTLHNIVQLSLIPHLYITPYRNKQVKETVITVQAVEALRDARG